MLNLEKVAKNGPAEAVSANTPKFSFVLFIMKKEERLNDLQGSFCQHHGDAAGSAWSVLGLGSVGMTQGCKAEPGMGKWKADRCWMMRGKFYLWVKSKLLFSMLVFKWLMHCLMSLWAGNIQSQTFPLFNAVRCCTVSVSIFPVFSVFSSLGSKLPC